MRPTRLAMRLRRATSWPAMLAAALTLSAAGIHHARADCGMATLGHGHVAGIVDARTLRLTDGREVRLAGIVPATDLGAVAAALGALVRDREIVLRGDDDAPDRYGRQHAFVAVPGETSVQVALLDAGLALAAGTGTTPGCVTELVRAEAAARERRHGVWSTPDVIKNAESPGDILAKLGRFAVIEGKVASARQAGATLYLNFGPRWTRDFAVIIRRPMLELLTRDNLDLKQLAGRRVRVRGWIERRGGPRIELRDKGQIEILDPL